MSRLDLDEVLGLIEPLLTGGERRHFTDRDLEYTRDLGLVAPDPPIRIANPIYAEVVGRSWEEKIFHRRESAGGRAIDVWGM